MTRFYFGLLAILLLAPASFAQGNGATLLAKVRNYNTYNDIWGYTDPTGREYAIVGTSTGTAIYNCVDPTAPYETAFIPGPGSIWRDMKTYGKYAYIVTEGGGGMQIVDLNDPENPVLVKTWGTQHWNNAHDIAIDLGAAKAYICGTNAGMKVVDLSNPTNPSLVATYSGDYVHDLHVQNGYAHLAEIYPGRYRIVKVSSLPNFPNQDSVTTPGKFTHNVWVNANDTIAITTDESSGGHITIYDVSDKRNIKKLSQFTVNPISMVHNTYIVGNRGYASWYAEGMVCFDISDPSNPTLVATYDTSSFSPGTGFRGAWGCYPFSPSGVIYINDIEEGFHIVRIDGQSVAFNLTPLPNTQDETGPYSVSSIIQPLRSGAAISKADLWYRVDQGSWKVSPMAPTGNPDEWGGAIPGQASPATVEYYVHATDDGGRAGWYPASSFPGDNPLSFVVGIVRTVYFNDFDGSSDEGWTHGGSGDDFQRGAPQGKSGTGTRHDGTTWYDPDQAFSGKNIWGNDLGLGTNGSYPSNASMWLQSPTLDCSGTTNTQLLFQRWSSIEGTPYDSGRILVNGKVVWQSPAGFTGPSFNILDVAWRQQTVDISAHADGNPAVVVRFELDSDSKMELGGWGLDDFSVISLDPVVALDTIVLAGPATLAPGAIGTWTINSAPANAPWWLIWSTNTNGSVFYSHSFDLGAPISIGAQGTADATGAASAQSPPIPAAALGRTFWLEIAALVGNRAYDSNALSLTIQ